ncbi:hypothetical protein EV182_005080, partial [Spiromyces aspiralis]
MSSLLSHLGQVGPVTKTVASSVFALSVLGMLLRFQSPNPEQPAGDEGEPYYNVYWDLARFLVLKPGMIMSYPWTLLTAGLTETDPLSLICALAVFIPCGAFLERHWGVKQYAMFLAVAMLIPILSTMLLFILLFALQSDLLYLYKVQINGLASVLIGFAVAFKQISPDHIVKLYRGRISIRCSELPGIIMFVVPPILTLAKRFPIVVLLHLGFFECWMYLRFFKYDGNVRGDLSETFSFSSFFPEKV